MRQSAGLAFVLAFAGACAPGGDSMKPEETPQTRFAVEFAKKISSGDAPGAHAMLASNTRAAMTPEQLAAGYRDMVAYGTGAPAIIAVMTTMDEWPDKRPGDLEWVYVAIANDTYSEAATVVVAKEGSGLVIRSIEW